MSVVVDAPSAQRGALSEVDQLFATLDGARISNGQGEWSPRIHGIYADGPYVWVQLSRDDHEAESVVLRLTRPATTDDIVRALETVRFEADSPTVVRL
jgi:hypothetical protein